MDIYCTRPSCPNPLNSFPDFNDSASLDEIAQKYCAACGMPLILDSRFLPQRPLSRGAFGTTFQALALGSPLKLQCVVKRLQPPLHLNSNQLMAAARAFRREADVLNSLGDRHAQIPTLYAYCVLHVADAQNLGQIPSSEGEGVFSEIDSKPEVQEFFYLVQEFVDGADLRQEIAQRGKFSEAEIVDVLQQILPVLQFIHDNGAIHRDIKPDNIVRETAVGEAAGKLFLIDFGAVKQVTAGVSAQSSIVFGTSGYAPPEQVSGEPVYPSTDLYALGVTCLYLLTGKRPQELMESPTRRWNWRVWADVSDRLAAILDRMVMAAPSDRFESAAQVLAALAGEMPTGAIAPAGNGLVAQQTQAAVQIEAGTNAINLTSNLSEETEEESEFGELNIRELLRRSAIAGSGSWLLAIGLVSLLGTVWISTLIWLLLLAGVIFSQYRPLKQKFYFFITLVITNTIIFVLFPAWFILNPVQLGIQGLAIVGLLTVLAILLSYTLMGVSRLSYRFVLPFFKKIIRELI
ncbi:MAG: protein kinase [Microcoleus sp. CAN_BIN18]|nr:protein kinase [Microcoleus sp. CAN_BIN18]